MYRLTIFNWTSERLVVRDACGSSTTHLCVLHPRQGTRPIHFSRTRAALAISYQRDGPVDKKGSSNDDLSPDVPREYSLTVPLSSTPSWRSVAISSERGIPCAWSAYRLWSTEGVKLLILSRHHPWSFLSDIPDGVPLSSLTLPGTHDTMAFYGWPLAQCQSLKTPLAVQLRSGIRVLDIRLSLVHDRLIAYHDIYPQKATFQSILADVHDYFSDAASCRETVVMSIKQEDWRTTPARAFSAAVRREIEESEGGLAGWFLDDRIPSLGEIRGKIVMFSRFGGDGAEWEGGLEGLGIHPSNWPDSEKWGFTWNCKNTLVRTHDWYRIPSFLSIPEKVELATRILLPPANEPPTPCLNITYLSASSLPLAMPPTIARGFGWPQWGLGIEGVNARVGRWLLGLLVDQASTFRRGGEGALPLKVEEEQFQDKLHDIRTYVGGGDMQVVEPRVRGWVMMDFYTDPEEAGLVPLLIELNFRGRIPGQEGWPEADSGSWNRV